ncbi:MAG: hypothetical protein CVU55_06475 [Deltaproteobacteria bacterium HGW-Deltaproteobacteria-13]|nr:MAG: hypothetical protein CVU55_06475 [Deltaproteobacteria bacterium HGW-Deltaproteobacteria-13]
MTTRLRQSTKIWKLAKDLGIKTSNDPVSDILNFCEKRIKNLLKEATDCHSLSDFLSWIAGKLGTSFEEIYSDNDLMQVKEKYLKQGEKIFVTLDHELSDDMPGITYRRSNREPWEFPFVSIIDCRGKNVKRAYYTKWHEVAHLLVLTDQSRLCFTRTLHLPEKDPEEQMVDIIAGKFGFYSPFIKPHIKSEISFEKIDSLRQSLCPDASNQSSLIGFVKAWPEPCILLLCKAGLKMSEIRQAIQTSFFDTPAPVLRAVKVTANEAAKEMDIKIFENMRVPKHSIIYDVHNCITDYAEALEDLSWWETSNGTILQKRKILVKAKNYWGDTYVLIIPKSYNS